jgi:hypothetical protein
MAFIRSEKIVGKVNAALDDIRNTIKVGFEIETDLDEDAGGFDQDAAYDAARGSIDEYSVCSHAGVPHCRDWITALGCRHDPEALAEALNVDMDELVDELVDNYRDNGDFNREPDLSEIADRIVPSDFTWCEDGSVNGPEFQSPICQGREEAIGKAAQLFRGIDSYNASCDSGFELEIHTRCSAHIHLQLDNIQHKGANAIQQTIFDELSKRWQRLPACVRNRIEECNKWIRPTYSSELTFKYKYNPIQCHHQGTWEFRLFGNVSSADEFEDCLDVAIESMECAYKRLLGDSYINIDAGLWVTLATDAMRNLEPMQYPESTFVETPETTESTPAATHDILLDFFEDVVVSTPDSI